MVRRDCRPNKSMSWWYSKCSARRRSPGQRGGRQGNSRHAIPFPDTRFACFSDTFAHLFLADNPSLFSDDDMGKGASRQNAPLKPVERLTWVKDTYRHPFANSFDFFARR